jgi:1,4-dihydroxy-2-naphthoyl-CoA hydrolase
MGIEILRADPGRLVARMPVEGNTQPFGLLHGGASCVLVETLGSWGAALHGAPHGLVPLGVEINATHHRSTAGGTVTAVAEPLHLGRTLVTYQVRVMDDQGLALCTGRITCLLSEPRKGLTTQRVQATTGSVEDPAGPVP